MDCDHLAILPVAGKDLDGPLAGELGVCAFCLAVLRFGEGHTLTVVLPAEVADNDAVHRVVAAAVRMKGQIDR